MGPQGIQGAAGAQGPAGVGFSLAKVYTVDSLPVMADQTGMAYAEALCLPGDMAISGGCRFTGNVTNASTLTKVYDFGVFKKANGQWGYSCTGTNATGTYAITNVVCLDL